MRQFYFNRRILAAIEPWRSRTVFLRWAALSFFGYTISRRDGRNLRIASSLRGGIRIDPDREIIHP